MSKIEYDCGELAKIRSQVVCTTGITITNEVIGIVLAGYQETRKKTELPQDVEEFIAETACPISVKDEYGDTHYDVDSIDVDALRTWMADHVRVPVDLLEDMVEIHAAKGTVRTVHMDELEDLLNASKWEPEPDLWCVHILGPDDLHAAPSKAYAEVASDLHNRSFADLSVKQDVVCKAVVAPWPYSAESHAEDVVSFVEDWFMPEPIVSRVNASKGEL